MSLIHVVNVILLLEVLPVLLIFEYLGQNTLGARWLALMLGAQVAVVLNAHATTVHGVELVLHAAAGPGRSAGSSGARVATLRH